VLCRVEIAANGDVYKATAAEIYHTTPDKIAKGSEQRQVGKAAVLGLGYGMGDGAKPAQQKAGAGFLANLRANGIDATPEFAARVVKAYRTANRKTVKFWRHCNEAAISTIKYGYDVNMTRQIRFRATRDWLTIRLPSGRELFYRQPTISEVPAPWDKSQQIEQITYWSVNGQTRKWELTRTYGGKLTENIVQAVARDFLVSAMFRVEQAGYPIILTVHDEIVSETDADFGSLGEFERLMSDRPNWGADCPIAVEGYEAERYRK